MGGDHSPPPLTLPPPQARSNAPRADGPTGLKLSSGPKEEPKCVPPLPMVIPLQRAFSRDRSIPVVSRKKMGSCAPRWNGSYNTPVDLLGKRGGVTADEKRSVPASLSVQNGPGSLPHHEASRIPENSGDVAPGISFDDDASSPVSRRLRIPPKFNKNQDKSCNVTTDLIPSFTLPGSQLEDTVEAPTTQSQPVVTKGKTESVIPSKDMQRAEPRKSYNISRDEALERKQEGRFVHHISTIPSNKQGASDNVGVPSGKAGGVPRAEAGRNRFESFRPTALSLRPDDRDPLGALSPRLKNRVHERRVSRKLN
ncbi:hypothetical protein DQ04_07601010 [Trypanosoma grayi]|uniref:hypothetical protein n=1 Tax=Trypanosoma grayi TaxID=71804 RepID=UPI0004F3F008|nr:hypothetical protein DQ04_07601010 [Trypanosoma grayi]KEG08260.1 hypothetical protein DQ04_07601010 [Trypanosoma grayi]